MARTGRWLGAMVGLPPPRLQPTPPTATGRYRSLRLVVTPVIPCSAGRAGFSSAGPGGILSLTNENVLVLVGDGCSSFSAVNAHISPMSVR